LNCNTNTAEIIFKVSAEYVQKWDKVKTILISCSVYCRRWYFVGMHPGRTDNFLLEIMTEKQTAVCWKEKNTHLCVPFILCCGVPNVT